MRYSLVQMQIYSQEYDRIRWQQRLGRAYVIGYGKRHLISSLQPAGTELTARRTGGRQPGVRTPTVHRAAAPAGPRKLQRQR